MPEVIEEKMPWESLTDLTAFIGIIATLVASFGYKALTVEQVAGISTILFVLVLCARKYGSGGPITLKKKGVIFVKMNKEEYQAKMKAALTP